MTDGSVSVVVWFLRKIRPTQLWVELGCGKNVLIFGSRWLVCVIHGGVASIAGHC